MTTNRIRVHYQAMGQVLEKIYPAIHSIDIKKGRLILLNAEVEVVAEFSAGVWLLHEAVD